MRPFSFSHFLLLLCLLSFALLSTCLYEDQTGKFDWSKENIGEVEQASFHATPTSKRIYVSTKSDIIAALNLRTGDLIWRKKLQSSVDKFLFLGKNIFVIYGSGQRVSLWNAEDGALLWDDITYNSSSLAQEVKLTVDAVTYRESGESAVAVLVGGLVQLRAISDGRILWTSGSVNAPKNQRIVVNGNNQLVGIRIKEAQIVFEFFKSRGSSSEKIVTSGEINSLRPHEFLVLQANGAIVLVALQKDGLKFATSKIAADATLAVLEIEKLLSPSLGTQENLAKLLKARFVQTKGHQLDDSIFTLKVHEELYLAFKLEDKNPAKIEFHSEFNKPSVFSSAVKVNNQKLFASVAVEPVLDRTEIDIGDVGEVQFQHYSFQSSPSGRDSAPVLSVFFEAFVKKNGSVGWWLLVLRTDASLSFYQEHNNELLWVREEGLISIQHPTETVDRPYSGTEGAVNETEVILKTLFHTKWETYGKNPYVSQAIQYYLLAKNWVDEVVRGSTSQLIPTQLHISTDKFGFRKVIVAMTSNSLVFGISSENGEVLWKRNFRGLQLKAMMVTRSIAHPPPEFVVIGERSVNEQTRTELHYFNPLTGEQGSSYELAGIRSVLRTSLPFHDSQGNYITVIVDDQLNLHSFPPTDEARQIVSQKKDSIYVYLINSTSGLITGFNGATLLQKETPKIPYWSFAPPADEQIILTTAHPSHERTTLLVRPLNDGKVLAKYLNKNLLSIATLTTTNQSTSGPTLKIYLLDTVTGAVIHRVHHLSAQAPVKMVMSDNWLVYEYWSSKSHRFEISVLELYYANDNWIWKSGNVFSSYTSNKKLNVLQQTYVFSSEIQSMGVTVTSRGITPRQLIFGLATSQVVAIDKALFDPRRPMKENYTAEAKEEGLIPYSTKITYPLTSVISYTKLLLGIKHIESFPTTIESTSQVLAYGHDLMFTRVQPARAYDMLHEGFNYPVVLGTTGFLLIAAFITKSLARKKELAKVWA